MLKNECQAGCMVFTGGDIYHHKDCVNYSESMSQMLDELKEQVKELSYMSDSEQFCDCDGLQYRSGNGKHYCSDCGKEVEKW